VKTLVLFRSKQQISLHSESITTNGQSVSLSWRQGAFWDPRLVQSSYDISLTPSWSVLSDDTRGLSFVRSQSSFRFPAFLIFLLSPSSSPKASSTDYPFPAPTMLFSLARDSHVPPVYAARHLPEEICKQPETLATGMEDRHQPMDERLGALC
jgi:hypothetical protein